MGRPTVVDDVLAEAVAYVVKPGMSVRKVHAALAAAGFDVSHATLARYLRRQRDAGAARAPVPSVPPAAPDATPADELTGLEGQLAAVDAALNQWAPSLGSDKSVPLTYQRLVGVKKDVLKAIDELKPRQSAEAERLLVLGHAAKAELLERVRATARADEDLRGRMQRQKEVIDSLLGKEDG